VNKGSGNERLSREETGDFWGQPPSANFVDGHNVETKTMKAQGRFARTRSSGAASSLHRTMLGEERKSVSPYIAFSNVDVGSG